MKLDLRPGRKCLIVPWAKEHQFAGWECTAVKFLGLAVVSRREGGYITAFDWWRVEIPNAQPTIGGDFGCRAAWLIPLPDDDEQQALFGHEPANEGINIPSFIELREFQKETQ